ncbi:hypothetical protein Ae201684P_003617 [Aphanomyces euteiches]|uniref:Uncharacterized protein n=1 Tax=Aphanomyces euteiches TaxID=100861 RepID=A0A6G0W5Z1_9STRA|nr:hypothetical protein Ae201684_018405 [Aphanomyces euteiches]KAH9064836.1 hypothetical protein Ae201684P_003617 [Aphanomyces euteiches]
MALSYNDLVLCAPLAKNPELKRFRMIYTAGLYVERPLITNVRFDLGAMADTNGRLHFDLMLKASASLDFFWACLLLSLRRQTTEFYETKQCVLSCVVWLITAVTLTWL